MANLNDEITSDNEASRLAGDNHWVSMITQIKQHPLEGQRDVLTIPNIAHSLAINGKALGLIDLINSQPLEGKRDMLLCEGLVSDLAGTVKSDQSAAVIDLINEQPADVQKIILTDLYNIYTLIRIGEVDSVIALIKKQPVADQRDILNKSIMEDLAHYANVVDVVDLIKTQPEEWQKHLMKFSCVPNILARSGKSDDLNAIKDSWTSGGPVLASSVKQAPIPKRLVFVL